jgi:hypothetical protein
MYCYVLFPSKTWTETPPDRRVNRVCVFGSRSKICPTGQPLDIRVTRSVCLQIKHGEENGMIIYVPEGILSLLPVKTIDLKLYGSSLSNVNGCDTGIIRQGSFCI